MSTQRRRSFGVWFGTLSAVATFTALAVACDSGTGPGSFMAPFDRPIQFSVVGVSNTYTLDADFDEGTLLNVNHDSPNNDQLQLNTFTTPFPFIWVAASDRGTIVKIQTETGEILGEYLTSPDGMGRNPSRTTVDQQGNVWVANRDESGGGKGSVARVGLITGGTRVDGDGTPNPGGQYLAPPYGYNTCVDRDTDGLIKTSYGLTNILAWTNAGGVDSNGGVSTAEDECIINYTRVAGTNARTMAIDANNDLWVGGGYGSGNNVHEKVDGVTGQVVPGTAFNIGCGGYGGLIDGNNVLWSSGFYDLLWWDLTANTGHCMDHTTHYGLGLDGNGFVWNSRWTLNSILKFNPDGSLAGSFPTGGNSGRGVAVTPSDNHVWIANSGSNDVSRLDNSGAFQTAIPVGQTPTGVAVDAAGKVWVTNYHSHTASRIDPSTNLVDLTVDLGPWAYPYNYSDMTGVVAIGGTSPQGSWTVVQDAGVPGMEWGTITWNTEPQGSEPAGTSITVEARAADTEAGLSSQPFVTATNGVLLSPTVAGQFIEVRATLRAAPDGTSPVLSDLTIETAVIEVDIDIKPGSDPNSINCNNANEVITVAILTTDEFDALTVDHTTVTFEGASETHVDKKTGEPRRHEEDVDGDGDMDLVFHFRNGNTALTCNSTEGTLIGETYEGRDIEGVDAVRMVDSGGGG